MSELDGLLKDLLEGQTLGLESYKHLIEQVEDEELKAAFKDNLRHLALTHKEIIFHLKEKLDDDSDYEDVED